jgi:hypothetical protein
MLKKTLHTFFGVVIGANIGIIVPFFLVKLGHGKDNSRAIVPVPNRTFGHGAIGAVLKQFDGVSPAAPGCLSGRVHGRLEIAGHKVIKSLLDSHLFASEWFNNFNIPPTYRTVNTFR